MYLSSLLLHFKSELEYKASFILSLLSQFIIFFSNLFVIIALFDKFNNIKGFTLYEVMICYSIINFGFSFCEVFARGIDSFDKLIVTGEFDRILIRPKNIMIQVLSAYGNYSKLSRIFLSLLTLIYGIYKLHLNLNMLKIITIILMMIGSVILFFSIFTLAASYCFLTIQGLEIRNLFTDGGRHMAQYPISIFKKGFVMFFTFIIPYAFVNYYPLLYFLGKSNNHFYMISPLLTFIYLGISLIIFNKGIKKYSSSGS